MARRLIALFCLLTFGCGTTDAHTPATTPEPTATSTPTSGPTETGTATAPSPPPHEAVVDERPAPMHQPIPLYEKGAIARQVDAATARQDGFVVLDLGEAWTPY